MSKGRKPIAGKFRREDYSYEYQNYIVNGVLDRQKLLSDAHRVAKAANQRLLRLERAGLTNAPAYKGAEKAISGVYEKSGKVSFGHMSKGRPRYNETVSKMSNEELLHMLYALDKTQQAKTATVGDVKSLYSKGLENLNKILQQKYASKITMNQLLYIFKSTALKDAMKLYGYRAVVQMMNDINSNEDKMETDADRIAEAVAKGVDLQDVRQLLGIKQKKPDPKKWRKAT